MLRTLVIALAIAALGGGAATAVVASPDEIQGAAAWIGTYFVEGPGPQAFSFLCGGMPSAQVLPGWHRAYAQEAAKPGTIRHVLVLSDPKSGLELSYTALFYPDHTAIELLLELRNTAKEDSPRESTPRVAEGSGVLRTCHAPWAGNSFPRFPSRLFSPAYQTMAKAGARSASTTSTHRARQTLSHCMLIFSLPHRSDMFTILYLIDN